MGLSRRIINRKFPFLSFYRFRFRSVFTVLFLKKKKYFFSYRYRFNKFRKKRALSLKRVFVAFIVRLKKFRKYVFKNLLNFSGYNLFRKRKRQLDLFFPLEFYKHFFIKSSYLKFRNFGSARKVYRRYVRFLRLFKIFYYCSSLFFGIGKGGLLSTSFNANLRDVKLKYSRLRLRFFFFLLRRNNSVKINKGKSNIYFFGKDRLNRFCIKSDKFNFNCFFNFNFVKSFKLLLNEKKTCKKKLCFKRKFFRKKVNNAKVIRNFKKLQFYKSNKNKTYFFLRKDLFKYEKFKNNHFNKRFALRYLKNKRNNFHYKKSNYYKFDWKRSKVNKYNYKFYKNSKNNRFEFLYYYLQKHLKNKSHFRFKKFFVRFVKVFKRKNITLLIKLRSKFFSIKTFDRSWYIYFIYNVFVRYRSVGVFLLMFFYKNFFKRTFGYNKSFFLNNFFNKNKGNSRYFKLLSRFYLYFCKKKVKFKIYNGVEKEKVSSVFNLNDSYFLFFLSSSKLCYNGSNNFLISDFFSFFNSVLKLSDFASCQHEFYISSFFNCYNDNTQISMLFVFYFLTMSRFYFRLVNKHIFCIFSLFFLNYLNLYRLVCFKEKFLFLFLFLVQNFGNRIKYFLLIKSISLVKLFNCFHNLLSFYNKFNFYKVGSRSFTVLFRFDIKMYLDDLKFNFRYLSNFFECEILNYYDNLDFYLIKSVILSNKLKIKNTEKNLNVNVIYLFEYLFSNLFKRGNLVSDGRLKVKYRYFFKKNIKFKNFFSILRFRSFFYDRKFNKLKWFFNKIRLKFGNILSQVRRIFTLVKNKFIYYYFNKRHKKYKMFKFKRVMKLKRKFVKLKFNYDTDFVHLNFQLGVIGWKVIKFLRRVFKSSFFKLYSQKVKKALRLLSKKRFILSRMAVFKKAFLKLGQLKKTFLFESVKIGRKLVDFSFFFCPDVFSYVKEWETFTMDLSFLVNSDDCSIQESRTENNFFLRSRSLSVVKDYQHSNPFLFSNNDSFNYNIVPFKFFLHFFGLNFFYLIKFYFVSTNFDRKKARFFSFFDTSSKKIFLYFRSKFKGYRAKHTRNKLEKFKIMKNSRFKGLKYVYKKNKSLFKFDGKYQLFSSFSFSKFQYFLILKKLRLRHFSRWRSRNLGRLYKILLYKVLSFIFNKKRRRALFVRFFGQRVFDSIIDNNVVSKRFNVLPNYYFLLELFGKLTPLRRVFLGNSSNLRYSKFFRNVNRRRPWRIKMFIPFQFDVLPPKIKKRKKKKVGFIVGFNRFFRYYYFGLSSKKLYKISLFHKRRLKAGTFFSYLNLFELRLNVLAFRFNLVKSIYEGNIFIKNGLFSLSGLVCKSPNVMLTFNTILNITLFYRKYFQLIILNKFEKMLYVGCPNFQFPVVFEIDFKFLAFMYLRSFAKFYFPYFIRRKFRKMIMNWGKGPLNNSPFHNKRLFIRR